MGGAGIVYPLFVLVILDIFILSAWVKKGVGQKKTRKLISLIVAGLFLLSVGCLMLIKNLPALKDIVLIVVLLLPILVLFVPLFHRWYLKNN
ncbi:MAG: hypothetical protein OEY19_09940 [Gammaproteobacteria bacterium]|nr:hypothetical protein [Gammaproteobacteria bacterium]MDH5629807.1 hypothetical protein [Gammaproteobacteria bacterium]